MGFAQRRRQAQRLICRSARPDFPIVGRFVAELALHDGKARVGEGKLGIKRNRLPIELLGCNEVLVRAIYSSFAAEGLQIKCVSSGLPVGFTARLAFSSGASFARRAAAISAATSPCSPMESASVRS